MTEWGVVGVIVTLIGIVTATVTPVVKLNSSIAKLAAVVERMSADLSVLTDKNTRAHDRLWQKNGEQDEAIHRHETDITILKERTMQR